MPETGPKQLKYLAIAASIRARIADGTYRPGTQLPASAALAREHGVALMTVRQALGILQLESVIEARHGSGTFVSDGSSRDAQRPLRVLLTEDDAELSEAVARTLRDAGFVVDVATSGGKALQLLDTVEGYGAIVLDMRLPDTDGLEIIEYIKANRPEVRVIVASGYVDDAEVLIAAERWPLMLLRKPYGAADLIGRLNALARPQTLAH